MRILSGIQPSGGLHLGNHFGMMQPTIELEKRGETFYFIANYHLMTSLFDIRFVLCSIPRLRDHHAPPASQTLDAL